MRKARSSKEKPPDLEAAPEESSEPAPGRRRARRGRAPEAPAGETAGAAAPGAPPRPLLPATSRPVGDDALNAAPDARSPPPVVAERPGGPEPVAEPAVVTGPDGAP